VAKKREERKKKIDVQKEVRRERAEKEQTNEATDARALPNL
jgi:hypothetical protein